MITINVDSREMFIPDDEKVLGVRRDNDSMIKVFRIPRFTIRGVDIADFTFKILYLKSDSVDGVEGVDDVKITDSYVIVRWSVGREAVDVPGSVQVMVEGTYCDDNGNIIVAWHSRYGEFIAYPAHDNLEPDENDSQYRDLLESLKNFIKNFIKVNSFTADLNITEPELNNLMSEIFYGKGVDLPDHPSDGEGGSSSGGGTGSGGNPEPEIYGVYKSSESKIEVVQSSSAPVIQTAYDSSSNTLELKQPSNGKTVSAEYNSSDKSLNISIN